MTITDADVGAWLERKADQWMEAHEFTSDLLPGVTEVGVRPLPQPGPIDRANLYAPVVEAHSLEFYAIWAGCEITVTRAPATRKAPRP